MSGLRHGVTIPLAVRCRCDRPRQSPVRMHAEFWRLLVDTLATAPPDTNLPAFEVYCRHCGTPVTVTTGDLKLVDNALDTVHNELDLSRKARR